MTTLLLVLAYLLLLFSVYVLRDALRHATAALAAVYGQLDAWDKLSKGPSMTTRTLRSLITRSQRSGAASPVDIVRCPACGSSSACTPVDPK